MASINNYSHYTDGKTKARDLLRAWREAKNMGGCLAIPWEIRGAIPPSPAPGIGNSCKCPSKQA